jgi:hypothetical protein
MALKNHGAVGVVVALFAILPAFTNIRVSDFQPEDFALLLLLGFCIFGFLSSWLSFRISSRLNSLWRSYCLLILTLVALSLVALRYPFFPLDNASFLKRPFIFSLSKLLQFVAVVCGFFWLTNIFLKSRSLLNSAMNIYWWTGICCCSYALFCYFFLAIHRFDPPDVFGAYANSEGVLRARGVFNEGGPFGVYILSVFVVGLLRRHLTGRKLGALSASIISLAFLLSASKAAFFAAALLGLYSIGSAASFRKRILYLALSISVLTVSAVWLNLGTQLVGYFLSYQNIEEEIATHGSDDYNLVVGKVSAMYIVPAMIETHPITGIGYGNYPLMRNDPRYLGPLPAVTAAPDLPGLGIPGILAEIGIPSTLWLLALLSVPYWRSRRQGTVMAVAGLFQITAHTFAVQLTFFYPWFVSACTLAAATSLDHSADRSTGELPG